MNILFYTKKGGQGKTTHAIGYAKYSNSTVYTNDYDNGTLEVYENLFDNNKLKPIKPGERIEDIEISDNESLVFDMGGYVDSRISTIAKFVDLCVVPICYQSKADIVPAVQTINELEKYNKNIVILINNTEKQYVNAISDALKEKFTHKQFIVNKSKYINRLADENKTIFDLLNSGGLEKHFLSRALIPQINEFYNYIKKINND